MVKKKARKKNDLKIQLLKLIAGIIILIVVVILAGIVAYFLLPQRPGNDHSITTRTKKPPRFEIYPKEEIRPFKPAVKPKIKPKPGRLNKIAIIIDDVGYDRHIIEKFLGLDTVLTFSILPYSPFEKSIAEAASTKGFEVMLHLPMEPNEYPEVNPGPGALLTAMSPDTLISQLNTDLNKVPLIKGVNNHMGSKMTTVSTQLYQIFSILKQKNLFFIDSRTTPDTICRPSARMFHIRFAQRNVFIDHIQKPDFMRKQLNRLLQIANDHGEAIGIGHPHEITYDVLKSMLPILKKKATFVPASQVVHILS